MARMDNAAIAARMMAIAFLAPSFARTVMPELRTALDAQAGVKARAGARGVAIRGEPGSGRGREGWRLEANLAADMVVRSGGGA